MADASLHHLACDAHPVDQLALVAVDPGFGARRLTFGEVGGASRRLASRLREEGVRRGERVVILGPQRPEVAVAHLAVSRLGAIAVPLSPLFGPDGLAPRVGGARPRIALGVPEREAALREAGFTGVVLPLARDFSGALSGVSPLDPADDVPAARSDAATLVFTSGTTGLPKGALLPHGVLAGRLPGLRLAHDPFPSPGDRFFSPADWSWIGGLFDSLLGPWALGVPVVAWERPGAFTAQGCYRILVEQGVRNAFLPPTALKVLMRAGPPPAGLALRSLHTVGEPLPVPVLEWSRGALGVPVHELYGLTEAAFVAGNSPREPVVPGSLGRPYPGHVVEVLRDDGSPCAAGEIGEICIAAPGPTTMLGYWRGEEEPPELPLSWGKWFRTGDLAARDERGFFRFKGRRDDLIKTSGYRVGPAEVEGCLLRHPAVAECAVVGVPDPERGQAVLAFVKLAPGFAPSDELQRALASFVRDRLAAHEAPRRWEFVSELPMTVSGKIRRSELRRGRE